MSNPSHLKRGRLGIGVAMCFAFLAVPVANSAAAPVDLQTAQSYSVLGGSTVTNTGSSVLSGDLGVNPGTALSGFGPATVNGATHAGDAHSLQAQSDLTTAYNSAAGQLPFTDLSGQDLGGMVLTPGNYQFSSSAQLTGQLTLNDLGVPNAQFVFQIGSTLTTASNASVIGTTSACNVYWQVGSSATIGTNTDFRGNIMADQSISMNTGADLIGRALARIGQVSLDNNVINAAGCGANTTPGGSTPGGGSTSGGGTSPGSGSSPGNGNGINNQSPPQSRSTLPTRNGTAIIRRSPRNGSPRNGTPRSACTDGFSATVRGTKIERVVFRMDGTRIASRAGSPFRVHVTARSGRHTISARVTFKDATRAKTLKFDYRGCAAQVLQPRRGPSQFTG